MPLTSAQVRALLLCIALVHGAAAVPTADAQGSLDQTWKHLSPDKRKQKRESYFLSLPEQQQQRLRESQRKFHSLPADQKLALCRRFLSQNGYAPPACRSFLGN